MKNPAFKNSVFFLDSLSINDGKKGTRRTEKNDPIIIFKEGIV
jgi:hypothetical protein